MTVVRQTIPFGELPATTSPEATVVKSVKWIKQPANVEGAETALCAQDTWFKANQVAVLRYAEENTRRLTGKSAL